MARPRVLVVKGTLNAQYVRFKKKEDEKFKKCFRKTGHAYDGSGSFCQL